MIEILIVDDSFTVRMDLTDALAASGFVAVSAGTLAEARSLLYSRPISLAILDVRLPDGDGIDLVSLKLDGSALPPESYVARPDGLTIPQPPNGPFTRPTSIRRFPTSPI